MQFDLTRPRPTLQAKARELARGAVTEGAAGYSRNCPLERMVRDARMFTISGGTAQILRTVVARGCSDSACRRPATGI